MRVLRPLKTLIELPKLISMIDNVVLVFVKNYKYNNVIYKLINYDNADMYDSQRM